VLHYDTGDGAERHVRDALSCGLNAIVQEVFVGFIYSPSCRSYAERHNLPSEQLCLVWSEQLTDTRTEQRYGHRTTGIVGRNV
jgi:hypothetical protein